MDNNNGFQNNQQQGQLYSPTDNQNYQSNTVQGNTNQYNMPPQKIKKPIYKKWWFWLIIVIVVIIIACSLSGGNSESEPQNSASESATSEISTSSVITTTEKETEPDVPVEYQSALKKAQIYSDTMYMSKQGIYDQLTSEYGDKFSEEAAQYAVDNVEADWKQNALKKAETYQETMAMSPEAIRDQLTSEYGEKFTQEEADYAVENLNK